MDQRLFKAASTTAAEAVTGIIPEGRKRAKLRGESSGRCSWTGSKLLSMCFNVYITRCCGFIAQAEEGASTEMAGATAADCNLLNLVDCFNAQGCKVLKGNHLQSCHRVKRRIKEEFDSQAPSG